MTAIFVTATGTDIGKTFVSAQIARMLRFQGRTVEALKPVISGFDLGALFDSDTGILLAATSREPTPENVEAVSPWRFAAPLSPDMAARREGRTVEFEALLEFCHTRIAAKRDVLLIEGVGGIMVPLDDRHTVLDWMEALRLPTILVAGSYLGTISHTLTALAVLARRDIAVMSVVVSESPGCSVDFAETVATIRRFAPSVDVIALPRQDGATPGSSALLPLIARL